MRRLAGAVCAAALTGLIWTSGASAVGERQSGINVWTVTVPGAATGSKFHITFVNPDNPMIKPHTVNRIVVHYPAGTVFDSGAAPQCHASDAELQTLGPDACPSNSQVGGGVAVSDTGGSGSMRYSKSTVYQFNGDHELLGVGVNQDIPAIKTVTHTKFNGTTASTDFPTFPGMGPPDNYTPLKSLQVDFPKHVQNGRATVRTPPTCPKAGYWKITTDFTYVDGVTQTLESHSPCASKTKPKPKPKPHKHRRHRRGGNGEWHGSH